MVESYPGSLIIEYEKEKRGRRCSGDHGIFKAVGFFIREGGFGLMLCQRDSCSLAFF